MSFGGTARLAVDSTSEEADDATYTAVGAPARTVKVLPAVADRIVDGFNDTRNIASEALFEVRASEVARPRHGDELVWNGTAYRVVGSPEAKDSRRLVWRLTCVPKE